MFSSLHLVFEASACVGSHPDVHTYIQHMLTSRLVRLQRQHAGTAMLLHAGLHDEACLLINYRVHAFCLAHIRCRAYIPCLMDTQCMAYIECLVHCGCILHLRRQCGAGPGCQACPAKHRPGPPCGHAVHPALPAPRHTSLTVSSPPHQTGEVPTTVPHS